MQSTCNQPENWRMHAANGWISKVWAGTILSRMHNDPVILLRKFWHHLQQSCRKKQNKDPSTKVVAEHFDARYLVERTTSTYLVYQNRTRDTISLSDLSEIKDWRADQEPENNIKDCIKIRCFIPILSHNFIRKLKILLS